MEERLQHSGEWTSGSGASSSEIGAEQNGEAAVLTKLVSQVEEQVHSSERPIYYLSK